MNMFDGKAEVNCASPRSNTKQAIIAYETSPPNGMDLIAAPFNRQWMDMTEQRFAYRCLPLVMANQAGWLVTNPVSFSAVWSGGNSKDDLAIEFTSDFHDQRVRSYFGNGVLTFTLPYLFRTPHGVNLLVKGPSNQFKDGIQALEAIVETDWASAPFTMNWKFTRPGCRVPFEQGEPICMIIPLARGLAEGLVAIQEPLQNNQEICVAYGQWQSSRTSFLRKLADCPTHSSKQAWQRDYFKGIDGQGQFFKAHQTKVCLSGFAKI